jgi:hypothetical protein
MRVLALLTSSRQEFGFNQQHINKVRLSNSSIEYHEEAQYPYYLVMKTERQ